jgi:hypothetical protein
MPKGYSILLANQIKAADPKHLGVQLGRVCIDKDIPVVDVANFFNVSRMTVYSWFRGESPIGSRYSEKMQKLVARLK